VEEKIRKLERDLAQQGFVVRALVFAVILDTAGLLVLWGERGKVDFDHIAVSLTVLQTMFAIAAVYGFWALRGLTREKAEETTIEEVAKVAPPLIRREVAAWMQTFRTESPISAIDVDAMVAAAGADGKEGNNGKK